MEQKKYLKLINFSLLENWSVQYLKGTVFSYNKNYDLIKIGDFLTRNKTGIEIKDDQEYKRVTIKMNNGGVFLRDIEKGENIGTKKQFVVQGGEFIMSKIDARNGAFGIIPANLQNSIITNDFPSFSINKSKINIEFLVLILSTKQFLDFAQQCSSGTTGRQRIDMNLFLNVNIPLPSIEEQDKIVKEYKNKLKQAEKAEKEAKKLETEIENYLMEELGIEIDEKEGKKKGLQFVEFKDLDIWNIWNKQVLVKSGKYEFIKIGDSLQNIKSAINKIQTKDYLKEGVIPIVSQENVLVSGYTNKNKSTINGVDLPLVVFGDHSKTVKLINFEFICGADGVRLMKPLGKFNIKYYYYYISLVVKFINPIESYTRHWKYLSKINIPLPPLEIQEKIVKYISALKSKIKDLKELSENLRNSAKSDFESKIFS